MIGRIGYALKMACRYRTTLKAFVRDKRYTVSSLSDVTAEGLRRLQVDILALDFDGVLGSHGEKIPTMACQAWLATICQDFGQERIVILSNNPYPERIDWFKKHYPEIVFVKGARKKPYPDGLEKILQLKKISPKALALVDDRLLTGILATCILGSQGFYVEKPYRNFRKRPMQESFFSLLRWLERQWVL